jgi:hypothetical protein
MKLSNSKVHTYGLGEWMIKSVLRMLLHDRALSIESQNLESLQYPVLYGFEFWKLPQESFGMQPLGWQRRGVHHGCRERLFHSLGCRRRYQ